MCVQVRRLLFCSLNVLVTNAPHIQLLGGIVLATVSVAVQFTARPFINDSLDLLVCGLWINNGMCFVNLLLHQECTTGLCIVFYISCGICFLDGNLNLTHPRTYNALGTILLVRPQYADL